MKARYSRPILLTPLYFKELFVASIPSNFKKEIFEIFFL